MNTKWLSIFIFLFPLISKGQFFISDMNGYPLVNDTVDLCESDYGLTVFVQSDSVNQSPLVWTASNTAIGLIAGAPGSSSARIWIASNIPSVTIASVTVTDSINLKDTTLYLRIVPDTFVNTGILDTLIAPCSSPFALPSGTPQSGIYSWNAQSTSSSIDSINSQTLSFGDNILYYLFTDGYGCVNIDSSIINVASQFSNAIYGVEIYGGQSDTISALTYNGIPTYSICSSVSSPTFGLLLTGNLLNFLTYSIDWGDGSQSSGNITSNTISHQYSSPSLYEIILHLTDSNNCISTDTLAFYYGTTQSLGLGTPGNTSTCFDSDIDSIFYDFQVLSWQLDPTGISYTFSSNDGSNNLTASSPLVENGVSSYPFLVYDSITGVLFYRHWFKSSSCGYSTDLAGVTYNNVFSVSAVKSAPCNGSQSSVEVGPILVSRSPNPTLLTDSAICINDTATISAASSSGILITSTGTNFECDDSEDGVWFIEDDQGLSLLPSLSTYTLVNGTSLGDTNYSASFPGLWTYGSTSLSIVFHRTGSFNITRLNGLVNIGSNTFCQTGDASSWICVDSIPEIELISSIPDTVCSFTDYSVEFKYHNTFCGDSLAYQITILDSTELDTLYHSGIRWDPFFTLQATGLGKQIIKYQAISPCGVWEIVDSTYVPNNPKIEFALDTVVACSDSLTISLGFDDFSFNENFNPSIYDAITFSISSQQNWTQTGTNALGLPRIRFDSIGKYTILLVLQGGCRTDSTLAILNYGRIPNSFFALDTNLICTSTLLLVDSIADTTGFHRWTLRYGTTVSTQIAAIPVFDTLSTSGIDTIIVIHSIENEYSCRDSTTELIILPERLFAEFTIKDSICSGQLLDLSNRSSGNIVHYNWMLSLISGDSIMLHINDTKDTIPTLTVSDFSLPFNSQDYLLSLTVYDHDSCSSSYQDTITVFPKPNSAVFSLHKDTICLWQNLIIDSVSDFGGNHNWYLLDSTRMRIKTYEDTILNSLDSITLESGIYILIHHISMGGGNLCDSTYELPFYVTPQITFSVNAPITTCATDTVEMFATSSYNQYLEWSWVMDDTIFSSSSSIALVAGPGILSYTLVGEDIYNCRQMYSDSFTVYVPPEALVYSNSLCRIDTLCPLDTNLFYIVWDSLNYSGTNYLASWDWNSDSIFDLIGDSAAFIYQNSGAQNLWLQWSNEFGCIQDSQISIVVQEALFIEARFNSPYYCGDYTPVIIDSTFGEIDSGYFQIFINDNFGNSSIVTTRGYGDSLAFPILSAAIDRDTTYIISFNAWNCCEELVSFDTITLSPVPTASLFPMQDTGCSPFNCTFQLDGFLFGKIDSAYLDFGDGQGIQLTKVAIPVGSLFDSVWQPITHNYVYQGVSDTTFMAQLLASNDCGDTSSSVPINVQRGTVLSAFSPSLTTGCAPLTVDFQNLSYNFNSLAWCFDFDSILGICDTNLLAIKNPSWTYTDPGTYTVALFVNANCGQDTSFMTINVLPSPDVNFVSPQSYCGNDTILFINSSNFSNGAIIGYLWQFGDGDSSFLINPTHVYDSSWIYQVVLTAFGDNGCRGIDSSQIEILPTPEADFLGNSTCLGDTVFFTNNSSIPNGQIVGYQWDFGDGNTSNMFSPYHIYSQPGTYAVRLTAISNSACTSVFTQYITVSPLPVASFDWTLISNDSCGVPRAYQFFNTSTNAIQFLWDFDFLNSGTLTSTLNDPQHTFTSPGNYVVGLYVENQFGCWDTIVKELYISEGIDAKTSTTTREGCVPFEVLFFNVSIVPLNDSIKSIEYVFGDGVRKLVNIAPYDINHTYNTPGVYQAYSVVTSTTGCVYLSPSLTIIVHDIPNPNFSFTNFDNIELEMSNLTLPSDTSYLYEWNLSTGQNSFEFEPTFQLPQLSNNYDSIAICLKVESTESCFNSLCADSWIWKSRLFVPNALAPELGYIGEDNLFLPKGHNLDVYELWIYDKWGNLVFYSDTISELYRSPAEGWNGQFMGDGEPLPMGVYSWRINAVFLDNKRWNGQLNSHDEVLPYGTLTLIR